MGGACSLGLKNIKNPVSKHQAHGFGQYQGGYPVNQGNIQNKDVNKQQQYFPNQEAQMNPQQDKNSNYNDSQKNQQFHLTNPFSTEQNGVGDMGDQAYEHEKVYQIGRYFLESNLSSLASKGKQKWQQFLVDGQKRLMKIDEKTKAQIFTQGNQNFIVNNTERNLKGNVYSGKESELSEFIEKGQVPQQDRWSAWKVKLNVQKYYVFGKYDRLLRKQCICEKAIKKDIGRAFPDQQFFKIDDKQEYHQKYRRINQSPLKSKNKKQQKQSENIDQVGSKQNQQQSQEDKQNSPDKFKNVKINSQANKDKNGVHYNFKNQSIFEKEAKSKEGDDENVNRQQNYENEEDPNGFLKQMSNQMKMNSKNIQLGQKQNDGFEKKNNELNEEESYMRMQSIGQQSLLNVLHAISNYFPNFRYTQGMNMVVGFFLLVNGGIEEEAFWMFVSLARSEKYLIMGLYENFFPLIDITKYIFDEKFKEYLPNLHYHIRETLEVFYEEWFFQWAITLFLDKFCLQQAIRFWDFIISQDSFFSIIQISLALLKELQQNIIGADHGQFHTLFNGFKDEEFFLWNKMHPEYIDIEKILQNAKKIKLTKQHIATLGSKYLTSQSNIISNKQRENMYSLFICQLHEKSQDKQKISLDTLNEQILIKIEAEQQSPDVQSDFEDSKLADQVNLLKKQSSDFSKIQNQFNKNDDQQKELSERQVIKQPQIDYLSSDIDNKLPKIRASPEKSQIGLENTNRSFLPPIKQKKQEKDGYQINIPDESNEPAKNKLKTIINPVRNLDEKPHECNTSQEEIQQAKNDLTINGLQSVKSIDTPKKQEHFQPLPLIRPIKAYSKRHQSSSDIHVMSLDQLDINKQSYRENEDDEQTKQKKQLPFFNYSQNQADIRGEDSTPQTQYFFNSPNKVKKKIQRSNSQNIKDSNKIKRNNNYLKTIIKNDKNSNSNEQIIQQNSQNNQNSENNLDFTKIPQILEYGDRQISSTSNVIHLPEIQKYHSKLPSINLNSDKKSKDQSQNSQIDFDQEQNQENQEKDNDFDENDNNKQHSSSQTQIHLNQYEDDFNIEQKQNNKKSLSHQTTNSLINIPNLQQKSSQNQNFENLENGLKSLQLNKNSVYSSRPSSHCSSNEYYNKQKKLQQQSQNTPQKNLSAFSTPQAKGSLQNLSFQKSPQVASHFYVQKQTEMNNKSEKLTPKNLQINDSSPDHQNSERKQQQSQSTQFISIRNKNKIKKFRPSSNIQKNSIYNPSARLNSMGNMEDIYKDDDDSQSFIEQEKIYKTPTKIHSREINDNNEDNVSITQENKGDKIEDKLEINQSYIENDKKFRENNEANVVNIGGDQDNQESERKQSILQYQNESSDEDLDLKDEVQRLKVESQKSGQNIDKLYKKEGQYLMNETPLQNMRQIQSNFDQILQTSDKQKNQVGLNSFVQNESQKSPDFIEEVFHQILNQQSNNFEDYKHNQQVQIKDFQNQFTIETDVKEEFQKQIHIPIQSENDLHQESKEDEKPQYNSMLNSIIEQQKNNQNHSESINDHFQTDQKKEDQTYSQNNQNSNFQADVNMSGYINELPQHNISGYSIQLHNTSHGHAFQNNFQNSQIHNQPKTFSINQIPSPTNSRIHDDVRSQISEISYGHNNQNQQDQLSQQNNQFTHKYIQSDQDNQITLAVHQNQTMNEEKQQIKNSSGTLETFRDYDSHQLTEEQLGQFSNNSNKTLTDTNFKLNSVQVQQNDQISKLQIKHITNNYPNSQLTSQSDRNDSSFKILQAEAPFIPLNNTEQPTQRNYTKSNSLVQLGNAVTQNVFHNISSSPSQSLTTSNMMKYKNNIQNNSSFSSSPQQFPYQISGALSGNDKVNNYVTYHNHYLTNSNYHLQEIQEENDGENAYQTLKNKKHQGKDTTPFLINSNSNNLDEQDDSIKQNKLNDSHISSKSNQTLRSKLSLTNHQQQFDIDNQNDILDEFSHSQLQSNTSASKIQMSQSHIQIHTRKSSINKNVNSSQNQSNSDHTNLRIISSAAKKNLVQGSQNSTTEINLNTSQQQISQKKYSLQHALSQSPVQNQNKFNRSFNENKNSSKKSSQQSLKTQRD